MRSIVPIAALVLAGNAVAAADGGPLASARFRAEHQEIQQHLRHIATWTGQLRTGRGAKAKADPIVRFFKEHIAPHAEWEEQHLYPLIDQLAGTGENAFTASMRHEHRIVARWIGELEAEAKKPKPDYVAFARRADNLLGLLTAHFEEEEQVLLPLADRKLTPEQFEARVGGGPH